MGTISVIAAVSSETAGASATQGGVSFSWLGDRTRGTYVGGQPWVYVPSGSITVYEPTPAETVDGGGLVINGAEINPLSNVGAQGYDENATKTLTVNFDGTRSANFPTAVTSGDVLVKQVHYDAVYAAGYGVTDEWATCYFVDSIPAANSFAPAAIGWSGRASLSSTVIDVAAWVSANCPNYDTSGHTHPSYSEIMDNLGSGYPTYTQDKSYAAYQDMAPHNTGGNEGNYGRYVAGTYGAAALALCSSTFTTEQKIAIATRLIDNGKQWYDPLIGEGVEIAADGGHNQWQLVPMAIYLHASGQTAALATLITDTGANYKGQPFQITADMLANDFVPHTSTTKPFTWRQRTIPASGVTGLNVKVPWYAEDPYNVSFTKLILTRVSDSATATVTGMLQSSKASSEFQFTIDAQPTPAFADGDVVYFETPYPRSAGDYEWGTSYVTHSPAPTQQYRSLNLWSGQLLGLKALGCFPADGAAMQGYVETANAANTPAADFDHPSHHAAFFTKAGTSYPWEAEFWADHAATILA